MNLNGLNIEEMILKINDVLVNYKEYYEFCIPNVRKLKQDFFFNPEFSLWGRIKKLIREN